MHSLPNIINVVKSRMVKWTGHAESMGGIGTVYDIFISK